MNGPTYMIRKAGQRPGTPPTEQTPVVGRVYACMDLLGNDSERSGALVRYEGNGCWSDADDPESDNAGEYVLDADYLQEQFWQEARS